MKKTKTNNQIISEDEHKKAVSNGLYSMLTQEHQDLFAFWRIVARASGFRAGELITLSYPNDVPSYPMFLDLFIELSTSISGDNDKATDVLWLCSSKNNSFIMETFDKVVDNLMYTTKINDKNLVFGCDNTNKIINCIKQTNPKIIFIDNFQLLDGSQQRNSQILSKVCRQYNVCIIVLNEPNNVKEKQMPDITKIGSKSGLLDRSDKAYIFWNPHQKWWRGKKENTLYAIVCDLVKNRQSKLIREYLFFYPNEYSTNVPEDSDIKKITEWLIEDYYDNDSSANVYPITSAINELQREIRNSKPFKILRSGIIL